MLSDVAPLLSGATSSLSEAEILKSSGVHDVLSGDDTCGRAPRKERRLT